EREAAQLLAVELEQVRVGDRERRAAVRGLGEQRHRAEEAAGAVAHEQDLLAGDLARRLELALEDDVELGRALALMEEELPGRDAALAAGRDDPHEIVLGEALEHRDVAQTVDADRRRGRHRATIVDRSGAIDGCVGSGRVPAALSAAASRAWPRRR